MLRKDTRLKLKDEVKYELMYVQASTFLHQHVCSMYIKNKRSFLYAEKIIIHNYDKHRHAQNFSEDKNQISQSILKIPLKSSYKDNYIIRKEYRYHE